MVGVSCRLVIIDNYRLFTIAFTVAIYPHVVSITIFRMVFHYDLEWSFIGMNNSGVIQIVMKFIVDKRKIILGSFDHPVSKSVRLKDGTIFLVAF